MLMTRSHGFFALTFVGICWTCVSGLQRPPPRYSQQYMPETSFSCRNKIVGSYYADPETDCQLFHVCVSVAGTIQDYRFLCPNDTAFDQESQTCADWYDVDCEAATLYYASDNFDLYRIGSGLESLHYDSLRSDAEPQDHLQRSESNDAVRSSANAYNKRVAPTNFANSNNNHDILHGSSSSNYFNNRNNAKDEDYENEKFYDNTTSEPKKKIEIRKTSRKQQFNGNNINNYTPTTIKTTTTTTSSSSAAPVPQTNNIYNSNSYYNSNNNYHRNNISPTTTQRPSTIQDTLKNAQKYNTNQQITTRPTTIYTYSTYTTTTYRPITNYPEGFTGFPIVSSVTAKTTSTKNDNSVIGNSGPFQTKQTTSKPSSNINKSSFNPSTFSENFSPSSTTNLPNTNHHFQEYSTFQRNYNNIQRTSSTYNYPSSTASAYSDNYNNNGQFNYKSQSPSIKQEIGQNTSKLSNNNFSNIAFVPTTYNPIARKNDGRGGERYNSQNTDNGQYKKIDNFKYQSRDNDQYSDKPVQSGKSSQYYDSSKTLKKVTNFNNLNPGNTAKYHESSTTNYDFGKSSPVGFSPSSINHLAESPRSTTPVSRRGESPTTYSTNNFNSNIQRSNNAQTISRGAASYNNNTPKPFSTTDKSIETTTVKLTRSTKKSDYDYAYYDNVGPLEYDGLELEQVAGSRESAKIART